MILPPSWHSQAGFPPQSLSCNIIDKIGRNSFQSSSSWDHMCQGPQSELPLWLVARTCSFALFQPAHSPFREAIQDEERCFSGQWLDPWFTKPTVPPPPVPAFLYQLKLISSGGCFVFTIQPYTLYYTNSGMTFLNTSPPPLDVVETNSSLRLGWRPLKCCSLHAAAGLLCVCAPPIKQ